MSEHIEELISAYIDNELSVHERQRVEEHLYDCPNCFSVFTDLMKLTNDVGLTFRSIEAPKDIDDAVLQAIRNSVPSHSSRERYLLFVPLIGSMLFLAILLMFVGSFVFKFASVGWKIFVNLMYAAGNLLASDPYVIAGLIGFSLLLIIGSGFSLTLLLKHHQFRGERT